MMKTLPILLAMAIFCVHYASALPADETGGAAGPAPAPAPDPKDQTPTEAPKEGANPPPGPDKTDSGMMSTSEKSSDAASEDPKDAAGSLIPSGLFVLVAAIFTGWMQGVEIKL